MFFKKDFQHYVSKSTWNSRLLYEFYCRLFTLSWMPISKCPTQLIVILHVIHSRSQISKPNITGTWLCQVDDELFILVCYSKKSSSYAETRERWKTRHLIWFVILQYINKVSSWRISLGKKMSVIHGVYEHSFVVLTSITSFVHRQTSCFIFSRLHLLVAV